MVATDRAKYQTPVTPVCPCNECRYTAFLSIEGAVASSTRAIPYVAYILIGRALFGGSFAEIVVV